MKTVFKLNKIQTLQELANLGRHCYELSEYEKAQFENSRKSVFKKPFLTLVGNAGSVYQDIKDLKNNLNLEARRDSVIAVEVILSLSPEFFAIDAPYNFSPARIKEFANKSMVFANELFGSDRIAHAVLHLHETTPHLHIFVVPWEETTKRGRYDTAPYRLIKTKSITPDYLRKAQSKYWSIFSNHALTPLQQNRSEPVNTLKDHYYDAINAFKEQQIVMAEQNQQINRLNLENAELKEKLSVFEKLVEKLKELTKSSTLSEILEKISVFICSNPNKKPNNTTAIDYSDIEMPTGLSSEPPTPKLTPRQSNAKHYK